MSLLTFKQLREIVAPYAGRTGKCATSSEVAQFAIQVMEHLLVSGSISGQRYVSLQAVKGLVSLPPEVEVPIKVLINSRSSEVWNKWYTFHSTYAGFAQAWAAHDVLRETGNLTPLSYPLPGNGALIGIKTTADEDPKAEIFVYGKDTTGREVFTSFGGESISGERFTPENGKLKYGQVIFGSVSHVLKPKTNGYIGAYAVNPETKTPMQFLADWSPNEEKPSYRQVQITSRDCGPIAHVQMLVRVRLKDSYGDNEITLFDSNLAVMLAAQRIQSEVNNDIAVANYKQEGIDNILNQEGSYKKSVGSPIDIYRPLSGGCVKNII